jgi:hypothetical protein
MSCSLVSCINNFKLLGNIVIVTCAKDEVLYILKKQKLLSGEHRITVFDDCEVLPQKLIDLPGWSKQQYFRLHADKLCSTPIVACLSADTVFFKPVTGELLLHNNAPIIFYNRYEHTSKHLEYERQRVENVARLLKIHPTKSMEFGDFIMDFMLFEAGRLKELRNYLISIYGEDAFLQILPKQSHTLEQKVSFGEWTLYAVFLLDVVKSDVTVRNSGNCFIAQVHSARELENFHFDAHIVHFVDKSLDLSKLPTSA